MPRNGHSQRCEKSIETYVFLPAYKPEAGLNEIVDVRRSEDCGLRFSRESIVAALRRRAHRVGLVDLGLEGPEGLPENELGFAVRWRATPNGVRKAIREGAVGGVVVQVESDSVESTAMVVRAVERENKRMPVWLAMSSPHFFLLSKVSAAIRLGKGVDNDLHVLTPREMEVLLSIRQGQTNQAIALRLGVSLSTVKRHVEHILLKLAAKNRAQAAAQLRHQAS